MTPQLNRVGLLALLALIALAVAACSSGPTKPSDSAAKAEEVGASVDREKGQSITLASTTAGQLADENYLRIQKGLIQDQLRKEFQVTQLPDRSIRLGIASDNLFEFNSAEPRPNGLRVFNRIADLVSHCDGYVIHVIGHTDDYGEEGANRWISKARAISVARYLEEHGVPGWRIQHDGRGSSQPLVSNKTPEGKRKNRRVDVVIKPVLKGQEERAWMPPVTK